MVSDTSSLDWQLDCLARHILDMPTKAARIEFLERMRANRAKGAGPDAAADADRFVDDLRRRILRQHELRKAARNN
ncbi:DUF7696 family protein [Herbaspirillum camelliae]|uniref:DUF7696 family protein n=1 Tax=Herbaspirillum camelliae TaxID=1892903 RepID=UPI00094A012D|nr:hypothetical protein [Herbaspirillum camelliae]